MRDFKAEYSDFLQQYPFQTIDVNGINIQYQYGGKEGAPVIVFFHGLEMHEMWMPYALHLKENKQTTSIVCRTGRGTRQLREKGSLSISAAC